MKILVINSKSNLIIIKLFDMKNETLLAEILVEGIGNKDSQVIFAKNSGKEFFQINIKSHQDAINYAIDLLTDSFNGVLSHNGEITAIGHRVVHGGPKFKHPMIIDDGVKSEIKKYSLLAPLHNPFNLLSIVAIEEKIPNALQVAVFDTSFHSTIPPYAYLYGIPYEFFLKYGIRKYGFHGISHKYVAQRSGDILGDSWKKTKIISCHLGKGSSITAIKNGKSLDNTMGFTPLEGLIMGTRSGDLDPFIVSYIMKIKKQGIFETYRFLNMECGILGISGISSDISEVNTIAEGGNKRAQIAVEMFVHDIKLHIGSLISVLEGVDVLIFTADLGVHGVSLRKNICKDMDFLGITLDKEKNTIRGEGVISKDDGDVKVIVIPSNDELMIAKETKELLLAR